ncbi:sulfatase family protein [Thalassoglobus neptunius]|nr:sulfatase [Thalassoglobus neptunius]
MPKLPMSACRGMVSLAVAVCVWGCGLMVEASDTHTNVVVILADDCTWSDLGVYGGHAQTPNLDKLAAEGMTFRRCFQAAPMCSPTRHCLYTGLYPVKSGAYPNHTFVKPDVKSIAHYLTNGGYRVALSGKRHIHPLENFPFEFSEDPEGTRRERNPDFEAVEEFLSECSESGAPFGLFICSTEPHTPYTLGDPSAYPIGQIVLPPHYVDTPETRRQFQKYLAEITYFDSQVGRTLDLLEKSGAAESTLVMVLSEQGNSFPFAKWTCYDAGVQSGLIVRWPQHVSAGSVTDAMVEYVDVVPTLLEATGLEATGTEKELDGRSFLPVLRGETERHKDFTFSLQTTRGIYHGSEYYGIRSVRGKGMRYILNLTPEAMFQNSVLRTKWWKSWKAEARSGNEDAETLMMRYQVRPREELYDCENDPWNLTNLAGEKEHEAIQEELSEALHRWMVSQGDLGQETELDAKNRQWDFEANRPASSESSEGQSGH